MIDPTHTPPSTIRAHLTLTMDCLHAIESGDYVAETIHTALGHQDAALRLLDEADREWVTPTTDAGDSYYSDRRLLPDPSRGAPEPNEHA